jgi:hypothetical protein
MKVHEEAVNDFEDPVFFLNQYLMQSQRGDRKGIDFLNPGRQGKRRNRATEKGAHVDDRKLGIRRERDLRKGSTPKETKAAKPLHRGRNVN